MKYRLSSSAPAINTPPPAPCQECWGRGLIRLDELQGNLEEVISMLLEDGEPALESDFVGLQQISVLA